jgi:hypothetical protein
MHQRRLLDGIFLLKSNGKRELKDLDGYNIEAC